MAAQNWDRIPLVWETAVFNGLVTGGAETGSSGSLDNNFAYSGRLMAYPLGKWESSDLADLEIHQTPAIRCGVGFATTTIARSGRNRVRVSTCGRFGSTVIDKTVRARHLAIRRVSVLSRCLNQVPRLVQHGGGIFSPHRWVRRSDVTSQPGRSRILVTVRQIHPAQQMATADTLVTGRRQIPARWAVRI